MSEDKLVIRGSTKMSLNERFTNLKKASAMDSHGQADDFHDGPPPQPPPPPPAERHPPPYDPHRVPEYRGPMRTATSSPVYDRHDERHPYRSPSFSRGPPHYHREEDDGLGPRRHPLKHRLGSTPDYYPYPPRGGGYARSRAPYQRGRSSRGRGYYPRGGHPHKPAESDETRSSSYRGRGNNHHRANGSVTKDELDSQLDSYMLASKNGVDKQNGSS